MSADELNEAVAREIADDLFINGLGDKADRLELKSADGLYLGGWSKVAVADRIQRALSDYCRAYLKTKEEA